MTPLAIVILVLPVMAIGITAAYLWRRVRVVRCPETHHTAAVRLSSSQAALFGTSAAALRLTACSRWPERQSCGQECLAQLDAPADCLITSVLRRFYQGKICVRCAQDLSKVELLAHRPALVLADGTTREWHELEPDCLLETLETSFPICWDCHIVSWLYKNHQELITERSSGAGHEESVPSPAGRE